MAFPTPTSIGETYFDSSSGRRWICSSLNPVVWSVDKSATLIVGPGGLSSSGFSQFGNGVKISGGLTAIGNVAISGNLTVGGAVITTLSEVVQIEDNIIQLNSNATVGASGGIEMYRGGDGSRYILWDEDLDKWRFTNDGVNYADLGAALALPIATSSITGVAFFPNADFSVTPAGGVSLTGNVARTHIGQTFTGLQVFSSGLSANGLTGTLMTSSQPNITAVGVLNGLSVNNGLSVTGGASITGGLTAFGSVTIRNGLDIDSGGLSVTGGASITGGVNVGGGGLSVTGGIAGTLLTAAQTNITSVGVLNGLSVNNGLSVTGGLNVTGSIINFSSPNTTTSPVTINAPSLISTANVGALAINSPEPDIYLNDTDGGWATINIADAGNERIAFGKNIGNDFYLAVRDPAVIAGAWRDEAFVVDSSTGISRFGFSVGVSGSLNVANGLVVTGGANVTGGAVINGGGLSVTGGLAVTGTANIYGGLWVFNGIAGTLTTPAQPNITSVGTLTSLNSAGATFSQRINITNGGLSAAGPVFVQSNGLSVTGGIAGTIVTPSQTNITSVGSLLSLNTAGITSTQRVNVSAGGVVVQAGGLSVTGGANITGGAVIAGGLTSLGQIFVVAGQTANFFGSIVVSGNNIGIPDLTYETNAGITWPSSSVPTYTLGDRWTNGANEYTWVGDAWVEINNAVSSAPFDSIPDGSVTPAKLSTGKPTWNSGGTVYVSNGLNVTGGQFIRTGGLSVTGGASITGGLTAFGSVTIRNGLDIDSGGLSVTGGASITGNMRINASTLSPIGIAPSYTTRAWATFNGVGTISLTAGNVSSITDHNVGDYTVNFTTAMPHAQYAAVAMARNDGTITDASISPSTTPTTTTCRINLLQFGGTLIDSNIVCFIAVI